MITYPILFLIAATQQPTATAIYIDCVTTAAHHLATTAGSETAVANRVLSQCKAQRGAVLTSAEFQSVFKSEADFDSAMRALAQSLIRDARGIKF